MLAMLGLPLVYLIIDLGLALNRRKGDTYSEVLRKWGKKYMPLIMVICYIFGLLSGHWWW